MRHEHCKECGKVFQSTLGQKVCQTCRDRHERAYRAAKEVLLGDPNASLREISRETGVELDMIKQLSKEGLINVKNILDGGLECERCGREIAVGHMCEECEREVRGMLNTMSTGLKSNTEPAQNERLKNSFHSKEK